MSRRTRRSFIVGTRTSKLARRQTSLVIACLMWACPDVLIRVRSFSTSGDRSPDRPLSDFSDPGVFTSDIERAMLSGEIDFAVHSFKDLPIEETPGLTIAAVPDRADVRDVLVTSRGRTLAMLPRGATVGTSSLSRTWQLRALRPDLVVRPIRGNVGVRVQKVLAGEYDATILATAGLQRLGLEDSISDWFSIDEMTPSPAQAALAVQCRQDDDELLKMLGLIDKPRHRLSAIAERAFLRELGAGQAAPVGAVASQISGTDDLHLFGKVVSDDGRTAVRVEGAGNDPVVLGRNLASKALARGAKKLLNSHAGAAPA